MLQLRARLGLIDSACQNEKKNGPWRKDKRSSVVRVERDRPSKNKPSFPNAKHRTHQRVKKQDRDRPSRPSNLTEVTAPGRTTTRRGHRPHRPRTRASQILEERQRTCHPHTSLGEPSGPRSGTKASTGGECARRSRSASSAAFSSAAVNFFSAVHLSACAWGSKPPEARAKRQRLSGSTHGRAGHRVCRVSLEPSLEADAPHAPGAQCERPQVEEGICGGRECGGPGESGAGRDSQAVSKLRA